MSKKINKNNLIGLVFILLLFSIGFIFCACKNNKKDNKKTDDDKTFNQIVLDVIKQVKIGGGYYIGTKPYTTSDKSIKTTFRALQDAFKIDLTKKEKPVIDLDQARPTFCSAACYIILMKALSNWDVNNQISFDAWKYLFPGNLDSPVSTNPNKVFTDVIYNPLDDGCGIWGRANANGPGFAAMTKDLNVGINFEDYSKAQPGDFLKIFWNYYNDNTTFVGKKEHGHQVVYISQTDTTITFWSGNGGTSGYSPNDGYGYETVEKSSIGGAIFSRITNPNNFNNATKFHYDNTNDYLKNCSTTYNKTFYDAQDDLKSVCNIDFFKLNMASLDVDNLNLDSLTPLKNNDIYCMQNVNPNDVNKLSNNYQYNYYSKNSKMLFLSNFNIISQKDYTMQSINNNGLIDNSGSYSSITVSINNKNINIFNVCLSKSNYNGLIISLQIQSIINEAKDKAIIVGNFNNVINSSETSFFNENGFYYQEKFNSSVYSLIQKYNGINFGSFLLSNIDNQILLDSTLYI